MIVYLAWGSLYWNFDYITHWFKSNLYLPLEFSRISDQGRGRLTLVIDDKHGVNNKIWYGHVKTNNADEAIKILRQREKTTISNIAYINLKNNKKRYNNTPKHVVDRIEKWARDNKIDVVIWTDLKSNWKDIMKTEYSPARAYQYFLQSSLDVRLEILEYVYKAKNLAGINTNFSHYFFEKLIT